MWHNGRRWQNQATGIFERVKRHNGKLRKKTKWSNKGGCVAPIFVPPTPNGELAAQLRTIAENEAEAGVRFRIVETGGIAVKRMLQRSNPMGTVGCDEERCLPCRTGQGDGGNCRSCGINYQVECQLCPPDQRSLYIGETARNLYTRGAEHEDRYTAADIKSFMHKHQVQEHDSVPGSYKATVTGSANDCLTRQVREAVLIRRCQVPVLNSKTEWHQPGLYRIQNEIFRG